MQSLKFINDFPDPNGRRYDRDQWLADHGESDVIINCHASEIYYPDHWTPLSMKCAFNGKEFYQSGNALQCAGDDNFLIYNAGKEYSSFIQSDFDVESFTVNFSERFVAQACASLLSPVEKILDDPLPDSARDKICFSERSYSYNARVKLCVNSIRILLENQELHGEQINEWLFQLFDALLECQQTVNLEIAGVQAAKMSTRKELYKRLHMAKDLIDSSYQTVITLDTLARVALINPYYLLRLFKDVFQITPHQYLKKRRIEEAKKLLAPGDKSVTEICILVGFADIASFSKLFKKETGHSPSRFTTS